jgi:hypothetical protein
LTWQCFSQLHSINFFTKLQQQTQDDERTYPFPIFLIIHVKKNDFFLFDTVRIWEFSPIWTDFDKCHNLSKRNVKLILKVLSDLEPLRGSSNKKTYSTRSCVNWAFFGTRRPLKRSFHSRFKIAHVCQKRPNLHTNSSHKLLFKTIWFKH